MMFTFPSKLQVQFSYTNTPSLIAFFPSTKFTSKVNPTVLNQINNSNIFIPMLEKGFLNTDLRAQNV